MAESRKKICIFTSVHKPFDVRVFHREAVTLASAGYEVVLLAYADFNQAEKNGVKVKGVAKPGGRLTRITGLLRFYSLGKKEESEIYHFHDLELLPIGWWLKHRVGRTVIYDCHENYPETAYERAWLPNWIRPLLSRLIAWLEPRLARSLDAVICVVPDQELRLRQAGCRTSLIRNLPRLEIFSKSASQPLNKTDQLLYLGGLSQVRGAFILVDILSILQKTHPHFRLICLGPFNEPHIEAAVKSYAHQKGVTAMIDFKPPIPHEQVAEVLHRSRIGLIPWQPSPQTLKMVYPNKAFEYMACALPLVASDLPSLHHILNQSQAGLLAKADDAQAHADAICRLLENPELARQLGENGRRYVFEKHNWETEAEKLLALYDSLID